MYSSLELKTLFLSQLRPATRQSYEKDLRQLQAFLDTEPFEYFISATPAEANIAVLSYKAELLARDLSPNTINRRLSTIGSLCSFLRSVNVISYSLHIPREKSVPYRDTRGLPPEHVSELLSAAKENAKTVAASRDLAILRLMLDLGLRVEEVTKLNYPDDFSLSSKQLTVRGKGRYEAEYMTLPDPTASALEDWLKGRGHMSGPLFFNMRDSRPRRITTRGVHHVLSVLGTRIGQQLHPHKLRHTAITEACKQAARNEIALEEVLDFSRHKDVRTLLIYRDRERNVQGKLSELIANRSFSTDE